MGLGGSAYLGLPAHFWEWGLESRFLPICGGIGLALGEEGGMLANYSCSAWVYSVFYTWQCQKGSGVYGASLAWQTTYKSYTDTSLVV